MSIYFTQKRVVDPYQSYNSNVVNRYHEMLTEGRDCLKKGHSFQITIDSTSPLTTINISSGLLFKDNVSIENTSIYSMDMTDPIYYVSDNALDQVGNYWITVKYKYYKARPAIRASFQIFKPDEHALFNTDEYFFLKCVKVIHNGSTHIIDSVYDYDLDDPTIHREYMRFYAGTEYTLPVFNEAIDKYRFVYEDDINELNLGLNSEWRT